MAAVQKAYPFDKSTCTITLHDENNTTFANNRLASVQ